MLVQYAFKPCATDLVANSKAQSPTRGADKSLS